MWTSDGSFHIDLRPKCLPYIGKKKNNKRIGLEIPIYIHSIYHEKWKSYNGNIVLSVKSCGYIFYGKSLVNTSLHIVSRSSGRNFHSGLFSVVTSCLDSCSLTVSHKNRGCLIGRKCVLIELDGLHLVFYFHRPDSQSMYCLWLVMVQFYCKY